MGDLIALHFLPAMPDSGSLISPEGIHRITRPIAIEILGGVARIHKRRHHLVPGTGISHGLGVVGKGYSRVPFEVPQLYIFGIELHFHSQVACGAHIGEIAVVAGHLGISDTQKQIAGVGPIGIHLQFQPGFEGCEINPHIKGIGGFPGEIAVGKMFRHSRQKIFVPEKPGPFGSGYRGHRQITADCVIAAATRTHTQRQVIKPQGITKPFFIM